MTKSLLTNLIAFLIMVIGSFSPINGETFFITGAFALSGGITNWIAIHMLFEKVPLFYGSGVIPNRFEDFKKGIKDLIIVEFFNEENINNFLKKNENIDSEKIISSIGEDKIFIKLLEAIENSSLGNMLNMVGGKEALKPLKEPMIKKIKEVLNDFYKKKDNESNFFTEDIRVKVENIIDNRLKELSSVEVKIIIQKMIKQHLSWLVVWGGVIGALIGLVVSYIN